MANIGGDQNDGSGGNNGGTGDPSGGGGDANNGAGGDNGNSVFSGLDATVLESITKDGIKDVAELASQFVNQKQYLSSSIRPPGPEASDEARTAFYAKLQEVAPNLIPRPDKEDAEAMNALAVAMGRPNEVGDYTSPEIEGANVEQIAAFRQTAFDLGLTQAQLEGIIGSEHARTVVLNETSQATHDADLLGLSQEWGVTFEGRMTEIRNYAEKSGVPAPLVEALNNNTVGSDILKWLHSLSTNTHVKGGEMSGQDGGGSGGMTPVEARERALEITSRLAKMRPGDNEYKALMDKRQAYYEMAYPGASKGTASLRSNPSA